MHFYWKIIEELKLMGEYWTFNDPSLSRSYSVWLKKNADTIILGFSDSASQEPPLFRYKGVHHSMN